MLTLFERLTLRAVAVLPAPDEAPGRPRHSGARTARRRRRAGCCTSCAASRPRWSIGCAAATSSRPARRTAPASARCWRACTRRHATIPRQQPNLRGLPWWIETAPQVLPFLDAAQRELIESELAFQQALAASPACATLPRGPIHADLFRDNVMFEGRRADRLLRFLFRRCRSPGVRHRDLPERLVHRSRHRPARRRPRERVRLRLRRRALAERRGAAADAGNDARRRVALLALAPVGPVPAARCVDAQAARPDATSNACCASASRGPGTTSGTREPWPSDETESRQGPPGRQLVALAGSSCSSAGRSRSRALFAGFLLGRVRAAARPLGRRRVAADVAAARHARLHAGDAMRDARADRRRPRCSSRRCAATRSGATR